MTEQAGNKAGGVSSRVKGNILNTLTEPTWQRVCRAWGQRDGRNTLNRDGTDWIVLVRGDGLLLSNQGTDRFALFREKKGLGFSPFELDRDARLAISGA